VGDGVHTPGLYAEEDVVGHWTFPGPNGTIRVSGGGLEVALAMPAGRAVVVGSGMAGLFSTRVLSDCFDEVVLIDRDNIPEAPSTRAGVPQGRHFHALLPGGLNIARDLFPGFTEDLEAAGAVKCVAGQDFCAFRPEGKSYALAVFQPEPRPMGIIYFMSRALLEDCVRRRVEALPNVRTRYRSVVREPLIDGERVTGVIVGGEPIPAELVVDATGRNAGIRQSRSCGLK